MCGRYTLHLSRLEALADLIGIERSSLVIDGEMLETWAPRYNVAPSQSVPVLARKRSGHVIAPRQWGLLPAWATETERARRPINARIESIATLPTFREAFARRRVIVPATGYFEWRGAKGNAGSQRDPVWIRPRDGGAMALAGVAERWTSREGEVIDSFAIVTMDASPELATIHDRMPLELHAEDVARWLDPVPLESSTTKAIVGRSARTDHLTYHAVTHAMGSPRMDDPACVEPASEALPQLDLFGSATGDRPRSED